MTVTKIEKIDKKKSRIYIDERKAFVLYNSEIRKLEINLSEDISIDLYEYIMFEILKKRARSRALHLLEKQDRTKSQLIDKLKRSEYPEEIIDDAIEYVESYNYIDDMRYAKQYIRLGCYKKSKKQLFFDLQKKGIDKSVACIAYDEIAVEIDMKEEEDNIIRKIIAKKIPDNNATQKDIQKTYRYLLSKGFSYDEIKKYMADVHIWNEI